MHGASQRDTRVGVSKLFFGGGVPKVRIPGNGCSICGSSIHESGRKSLPAYNNPYQNGVRIFEQSAWHAVVGAAGPAHSATEPLRPAV